MKKQPIPTFASEDKEREFWASHDATDFIDFSRAKLALMPNLRLGEEADMAGDACEEGRVET